MQQCKHNWKSGGCVEKSFAAASSCRVVVVVILVDFPSLDSGVDSSRLMG
jgi:hypothetical protein